MKYLAPQLQIIGTDRPRNLLHAGQGGGKTQVMGFLVGMFVSCLPNALGQVCANTYGQLSDSTLVRICSVLKDEFGYIEDQHYVIDKKPLDTFKPHGYTFKSNNNKMFFENGAVVMLNSLDNYKALDGREIGWALLDETKDTREQAVKDVILGRLRQKTVNLLVPDSKYSLFRFVPPDHPEAGQDCNPLFIFTSPAKEQWLTEFFKLDKYESEFSQVKGSKTEYFHKKDKTRNIVMYSTWLNRNNLPSNYINNLIEDLSEDRIDLNVHGSPYGKSGNEYYNSFKKNNHVKPTSVQSGYPLHLMFDFNANPYMTGLVGQILPGDKSNGNRTQVNLIKGYPLKNPRNTVDAVCSEFNIDYADYCNYGFYFYGDATGKNTLPIAEYKNYFSVIEARLAHLITPNYSRRLLKQNPRHKSLNYGSLGRRDFMNKCFRGGFGFDINIDPGCLELIADLEFIKEDSNGAKKKDKVTENGVTYEKYGHFSDALDSFLCYVFGEFNKE